MTKRNPLNKTTSLNNLRTVWEVAVHKEELRKEDLKQRAALGQLNGKNLTTLAMKQGKKVYVKTVDGIKQLSLATQG